MALSNYYVTFLITEEPSFRVRIAAAAQTEAIAHDKNLGMGPEEWAASTKWIWAVSPGWAAKVQYAIASNIDTWGTDPSVISDEDIVAVIQPLVLALP